MGLFSKLIDTVIDLPGEVVKGATETVLRVPEAAIKTAKGACEGAEGAVDKLSEIFEDDE
jgi:hypothetical protein